MALGTASPRPAKGTESGVDAALRVAREVQPDLWKRVDAVARIIDPAAFMDDWIVEPASSAALLEARLRVQQAVAVSKASEVLLYLGVNTATDWYEVLTRLAEREE